MGDVPQERSIQQCSNVVCLPGERNLSCFTNPEAMRLVSAPESISAACEKATSEEKSDTVIVRREGHCSKWYAIFSLSEEYMGACN